MVASTTNAAVATIKFTARERAILETLTTKVRLLSLSQMGRAYWSATNDPTSNARRGLRRLVEAGYLETERANIHPELSLGEPALCWKPGDPGPELGRLAYRFQKRWTEANIPTTYYMATRQAARLMGGQGGPLRRRYQLNHDLHVATVYLLFRENRTTEAAGWISEDLLPRSGPGEKHPDALIRGPAGETRLVVEFAGAYDVPHLEKVHQHCLDNRLSYELW